MTPQQIVKRMLDLEAENRSLKETITKFSVVQDAASSKGLSTYILERLIAFDIFMLREGSRGIRWIGMSPAEYSVCLDAAKGTESQGMLATPDLTIQLPGGPTRCAPVPGLPNDCYVQLREPLLIRSESKYYQIANIPKVRNARADPFPYENETFKVTNLLFEIVPKQSIAVEVEGQL